MFGDEQRFASVICQQEEVAILAPSCPAIRAASSVTLDLVSGSANNFADVFVGP
jgi:hypothetical protein